MNRGRGPFALTLRRCLQAAALPTLATATLGPLLQHWVLPAPGRLDVGAAASPWLLLPTLVAAAVCALVAAAFWPLFARHRPGADLVRRLQRGRLQGATAVIAGALLAQGLLTAPVLLALPPLLGASARATASVTARATGGPLLAGEEPTAKVVFTLPHPGPWRAITLRPLAGLPASALVPTQLQLRAEDRSLGDHHIVVDETGQMFRASFAPQRFATFEVRRTGGNVPLFFPPDGVTAQAADDHPGWWNGLLATLATLVPTLLALAIGCLCGRVAALPTVLTVIGAILFVMTVGEVGPSAAALRALLRGEWLAGTGVFATSLPTLAIGCAAMMVASLVQPWRRR